MTILSRQTRLFILLSILLIPITANAQFDPLTPFAGTSTGTLSDSIRNIVNAFLTLAALVAAIALTFSFVTALAGRDEEDIARRARTTVIYILLGLVIIALSAVIINFIIVAIP